MTQLTDVSRKSIKFIKKHFFPSSISTINRFVDLSQKIISTYSEIDNNLELDTPICLKKDNKLLDEKGNIYWLLIQLTTNYPQLLNVNQQIIDKYIENTNCLQQVECREWLDKEGRMLVENICDIIRNNQLPNKLSIILDRVCSREYLAIYETSFMSQQIRDEIEKDFDCISIYKTRYKQLTMEIIVISSNNNSNYSLVKQLMKHLLTIIYCSGNISKQTHMKMKVFMSEAKKQLPEKNKPKILGINEVNTGSTYRGDCTSVVLWRKEELIKVATHEWNHCLENDCNFPDKINNNIRDMFAIPHNTEIRVYESYVELWAIIINLSIISTIDKQYQLEEIINIECSWCFFQIAKILHYFGFTKWEDFYLKDDPKHYKQESSILSYYIIKTALLYNIDEFIEWCYLSNSIIDNQGILPIKFNSNHTNSYYQLIQHSFTKIGFKENVNYYLTTLFRGNEIDKSMMNTLRMSCFEIGN